MANRYKRTKGVATLEVLQAVEYHQSIKMVPTSDQYFVYEYKVPTQSHSRYQYTVKIRNELVKRYNKLLKDVGDDGWPEIKEIDDGKHETNSFILYSLFSEKEELSDIMQVIGGEIQRNNDAEVREINQRGKKTTIVITENKDFEIKLPKFLKSASVILVVKDMNTRHKFSKTFSDRKDVYVCLREEIKEILSTYLERCAFTGMKKVCEFLQEAIPAPGPLKATTQRNINQSRQQTAVDTSPLEPAKAQGKSTRKRQLAVEASPVGSDHKRKRYSCLLDVCKENKDIKERTERLIDEIVGMFNRSNLPKDEHPNLRNTMQHCVDEKLLKDLRTLNESIRSCRYRFSTFQVCVDVDVVPEKLKCDIAKTLEAHNTTDYSIISSSINKFAKARVGSKVSVTAERPTGTLGGFAKMTDEKSDGLCVLLSRHVARFSQDGKIQIEDGEESLTAKCLNQINKKKTNEMYLDITAASVEKANEKDCDTRYLTEDNNRVQGRLCQYDNAKLKGLPVHICGAYTELGRGTITIPEQHSVQPGGAEENYILVENREIGDTGKFCTEGDSGAIVCADSPDNYGKEVQLISMVVGEDLRNKGSYQTVRLDKGLAQLSTLAKKNFEIC